MSKTHYLKTWPEYFHAVQCGLKPFEVRKDDRPYEVGDYLCLQEFCPDTQAYTGAECIREVTYILRDRQFVKDGFCVMGIR